ncbi:MAG: ABC transporter permease subunit [Planctomycetia bacterium]|nr:ABC transporter permease subunit [Planctomycetia bacterium]
MSWSNVRLILGREIRDQLRDRRTLFMIAVLPILLYPLLGMSLFQVQQFRRQHPTKVLVIGAGQLPEKPPLVVNKQFAPNLFGQPEDVARLELTFAPEDLRGPDGRLEDPLDYAREKILAGEYDAALCFPPDFGEQLERFFQASEMRGGGPGRRVEAEAIPQVPKPEILYTTANEESQITFARLYDVLRRWAEEVGKLNLTAAGMPPTAARPFELHSANLADQTGTAGIALWAKILPVMLLLWALTGAFYPAVDLCAGEKERGTLETLLSSPAERSEIVMGKLVTIMLFSAATAVLNLASMGLTGWLVLSHLPGIGLPPLLSIFWLVLALVPVSALFSALCLALAAFARSTKEGQYYLMPLLLVTMPLAVLPMTPGVELTLGNSLIPVTNVVLLLRATMEGDYIEALRFVVPVVGVTLLCCLLAIRWAVDQFNQESVLFRESERLDMGLWLQHLRRDRQATPSVAEAISCGVLILMIKFFLGLAMPMPTEFAGLATMILVTQLVVIITPALLMTIMLTKRPARTLLLDRFSWQAVVGVPMAILLAVAINPLAMTAQSIVVRLYPIGDQLKALEGLFQFVPGFWEMVLLMAVVPAICEELAFRGFILSGLRHMGHKWRAIVLAAVFFGMTHALVQQSIIACLIGIVIGYLAVQTGSLLPCIAFHMVHNTLTLAFSQITPKLLSESPVLGWMVRPAGEGGFGYNWTVVALAACGVAMLLTWFSRLPYEKTEEEALQDAIRKGLEAEDEPLAA